MWSAIAFTLAALSVRAMTSPVLELDRAGTRISDNPTAPRHVQSKNP